MSYKMIVTDLDGTMFGESFTVSQANALAVKRAMDKGCVFTIASGRPAYGVSRIARELGMGKNQYVICFNGALIADAGDGGVIHSQPLPPEDATYIIKNARDKGATIIAYINGMPYTHYEDKEARGYANQVKINITVDEKFEDVYSGDFNKVLIRGIPERLHKIENELSQWADGRVSSVYSSPKLIEYFNKDASKGNALLILAQKLGISISETIAIGDYYNDMSMIEAAGLGVVIKDSPKEVLELAGYITEKTAEEGAVSEVIEKFIL